jgi:hypothetical protein
LVVEYDEREPFKVLDALDRGSTHQRFMMKRQNTLDDLTTEIQRNFKSAKKPLHKNGVRSYYFPLIGCGLVKRGRPTKKMKPLEQIWPPAHDSASSISSCGF